MIKVNQTPRKSEYDWMKKSNNSMPGCIVEQWGSG